MLQSIFCAKLKVLRWSGGRVGHCPADWVMPSSCEDRVSRCKQNQAQRGLKEQWRVHSTSLRLFHPFSSTTGSNFSGANEIQALTPPTKHTNLRASRRTPTCILRTTRRRQTRLFASKVFVSHSSSLIHHFCQCQASSKLPGVNASETGYNAMPREGGIAIS